MMDIDKVKYQFSPVYLKNIAVVGI